MPKIKNRIEHIHSWQTFNSVEYFCKANYKGHPCIKIKIGAAELERRTAEWDNYYEMCKQTEAREDYQEMRTLCEELKLKLIGEDTFREKRDVIYKRIAKRMKVAHSENGETEFIHKEEAYLTPPAFPDPHDAKQYYDILTT